MNPGEKRITSHVVYRGRILNLRVDHVELENSKRSYREVVEHAPAVGILAEDDEGRVFLVKQFRYPAGEHLLEIPAGIIEPGERPVETASRELQEEIGFEPGEIREIMRFYTSPGFSNEELVIFHARNLRAAEREPDDDEFISVEKVDIGSIETLLRDGGVRDAKTIAALHWLLANRS